MQFRQSVFDLENKIYNHSSRKNIKRYIDKRKRLKSFPKNLTFINAYLDEKSGMSGCAFLDEDTGKVIIGFAGTNLDTSKVHGYKDVIAV